LYKGGDHYPEEYQAALDVAYAPVLFNSLPFSDEEEKFTEVVRSFLR